MTLIYHLIRFTCEVSHVTFLCQNVICHDVVLMDMLHYSHRTPIMNRSLPLPGQVKCGFGTNSVCPILEADGSIIIIIRELRWK
ncbi:MAG: hypothetical protein RLZZ226_856 [Pseudomonadota bacterium]|jgi:hypothetical protein